jgi:hypothetical protein
VTAPDCLPGWKPAEPAPPAALTAGRIEQCPVCRQWLDPTADGSVRAHQRRPRPLSDPATDPPRCPGSGTEDRREYRVRMQPRAWWAEWVLGSFVGRRAAEQFAIDWRGMSDDIRIMERESLPDGGVS